MAASPCLCHLALYAEPLPRTLQVYLPGIDGTGLAASRQFPYLVEAFDLRALSIPGSDRTPFADLVRLIMCVAASGLLVTCMLPAWQPSPVANACRGHHLLTYSPQAQGRPRILTTWV